MCICGEIKGSMWCKFHDCSVTTRNVCDDFFDEADTPLTIGLFEALALDEAEDSRSRSSVRDIMILILMLIMQISAWIFVFCNYMSFTH